MNELKENIIELVQSIDSVELLEQLEVILKQYQIENEKMDSLTIDQLITELQLALNDIQEGKVTSQNDLENEIQTWH